MSSEAGTSALRRRLVADINMQESGAAAQLLQMPPGPEIADLEPARLTAWRSSTVRIGDMPVTQIYGALILYWLQRQANISAEDGQHWAEESLELLQAEEITNPFIMEALLDHMTAAEAPASEVSRVREQIAEAAARGPDCDDADSYAAACWRLVAIRNATAETPEKARRVQRECLQLAEEFERVGDVIAQGHALTGYATYVTVLATTPLEAQQAAAWFKKAGECSAAGGDHAAEAASLRSAAAAANRGTLKGPFAPPVEELIRAAARAYRRAGLNDVAAVAEGELTCAPAPNSIVSILGSGAVLALLAWAFFKGHDALLFMAFIGAAILVHEGGHWLAAALVGIPIRRFRVGLGARLFSFVFRQTRVEVCAVPFMGYVMPALTTASWFSYERDRGRAGRRGEAPPPKPELDFTEEIKPWPAFVSRPRRALFYSGGLLANLVMAVLLFWGYAALRSSTAEKPRPVPGPHTIVKRIAVMGYKVITNMPKILFSAREDRKPEKDRWIRSELGRSYWALLPIFAFTNCILLYFNLLPIPPLDGSHMLFTGVEAVIRRDLSARLKSIIARVGYVVIGLLILLNVYHLLRDLLGAIAA